MKIHQYGLAIHSSLQSISYFRSMQKLLVIGLVWPEPTSSAAGSRMLQLIKLFKAAGYTICFACAASKSPYSFPLETLQVEEQVIRLNDSSFNSFVEAYQPDLVMFDRFMVEEQYGWRVREVAKDALTMLDTEDLHFLRMARQTALKKQSPIDYYSDTAKREIAAMLRCDLNLIIAREEMKLLHEQFPIPTSSLLYIPFLEEVITAERSAQWKGFQERKNLMFIGNFLHEPNWQTVQVLKTEVWPELRKRLPEAELHIYGAYASEKVYQLNKPKERFFIKDRADDARLTMENYRLLLAPIPFGAGAKGKFIDAMQSGTPNISSAIGAESMSLDGRWNGAIATNISNFIQQAELLYSNEEYWKSAQQEGIYLLNTQYARLQFEEAFISSIKAYRENLSSYRQRNFVGEILKTQIHNSHKYMSLWIEEKGKNK